MKTVYFSINCVLMLSIILFTSCEVQKRKYRQGYYSEWNNPDYKQPSQHLETSNKTTAGQNLDVENEFSNWIEKQSINTNLNTSIDKNIEIKFPAPLLIYNLVTTADTCDLIAFKSGQFKKVIVREITSVSIKYKECGNMEGPEYSVEKSSVSRITYADGTIRIIDNDELNKTKCDILHFKNGKKLEAIVVQNNPKEIVYKRCGNTSSEVYYNKKNELLMIEYASGEKEYPNKNLAELQQGKNQKPNALADDSAKKIEKLGVSGFIMAIIGLFVGGIPLGTLAVIFGGISLSKIKNHPEKYKNKKGFAIASIIIGLVAIIGGIVALALLL